MSHHLETQESKTSSAPTRLKEKEASAYLLWKEAISCYQKRTLNILAFLPCDFSDNRF